MPKEKFLRVRSYLNKRPRGYLILNALPVCAVLAQASLECLVLLLGPTAWVQAGGRRRRGSLCAGRGWWGWGG